MGMFDYVKYDEVCEKCGDTLMDFQSKDSQCTLDIIEPSEVGVFYSWCDGCKTMNYFSVVREYVVKEIKRG